jgi:glycogen operon protein
MAVFLNGDAISEPGTRGERITDDSFLLLFNASEQDVQFTIPPSGYGDRWAKEFDTALPRAVDVREASAAKPGDFVPVTSRSMQVLRRA